MAIRFSIQRLTVISFPSSCTSRPSSGALVMFWIILSAAVIHFPASANGLKISSLLTICTYKLGLRTAMRTRRLPQPRAAKGCPAEGVQAPAARARPGHPCQRLVSSMKVRQEHHEHAARRHREAAKLHEVKDVLAAVDQAHIAAARSVARAEAQPFGCSSPHLRPGAGVDLQGTTDSGTLSLRPGYLGSRCRHS
jgi:hypothetical protein